MPLTLQDLYNHALQGEMEVVGSGASKVVFEIDNDWVLKVEKGEDNYEEFFAALDDNSQEYDDTIVSDYSSDAFNQTSKEILYYELLDEDLREVLAEIDLSRACTSLGASVMRRYTPLNHLFSDNYSMRWGDPTSASDFLEEGLKTVERYGSTGEGARETSTQIILGAQEYVENEGFSDLTGIRAAVKGFLDGLYRLYLHAKVNNLDGMDFQDLSPRNLGARLSASGEIEKIVIIDYGYMPGEMEFLAEIA